jgi:hypothetical protein
MLELTGKTSSNSVLLEVPRTPLFFLTEPSTPLGSKAGAWVDASEAGEDLLASPTFARE